MLENINIFSLAWFTFFLLILSVGYYIVEIIGGRNYWYRKVFDNYSNNLFDRVMHYITWGLLINLGAVFSFIKSDGIRELAAVFNTVGRIADGIGGGDAISIQLFLFVCFYYVAIFIMLVTVHGMIKIFGTLEKISARIMDGKKEEINKVSEEKVKSILTTEIHA